MQVTMQDRLEEGVFLKCQGKEVKLDSSKFTQEEYLEYVQAECKKLATECGGEWDGETGILPLAAVRR